MVILPSPTLATIAVLFICEPLVNGFPKVEHKDEQFNGRIIFPGTKWCGAGDIATSHTDLGWDKAADTCCRDHDHCPEFMMGNGKAHNLTNPDEFSK